MQNRHFDVLIVGAGLSGIGAACFLQDLCPGKTYAILEMRAASGGTWDLFRYPGIRSDSDMYTLGYSFRPWTGERAIVDGAAILDYIRTTAREHDVERHIRYSQRVVRAEWSSDDARWTVEVRTGDGECAIYTCRFLHLCSGYFDYAKGYTPEFARMQEFGGRIVHPQQWTPDIDCTGKDVVVIGSGATAITLVPELARKARHVTMLQRSPTYVLALPAKDRIANALRRCLPTKAAYALTRCKNIVLGTSLFVLARKWPRAVRRLLQALAARALGGGVDMAHFTPTYDPWRQRLCVAPDGDLFAAIRDGTASVVTDRIAHFTATGLRLESGRELAADLVVTATGMEMLTCGGIGFVVDGEPVALPECTVYKGMMLSGVPNLAIAVGYTNASWTLKCDLASRYVCRLLQHMDRHGMRQCTPRLSGPIAAEPLIDFDSGYVFRSAGQVPKQGGRAPWKLHQNYPLDLLMLKFGRIDDEMEFSNPDREIGATAAATGATVKTRGGVAIRSG